MQSDYSSWSLFLPQGVTIELIMIYGAAFMVFMATMVFGAALTDKNVARVRVKELMARRAELRGEYINPKRRKLRKASDEKLAWMQLIVKKLNLLQTNKVSETKKLLATAGYRSKDAITKFAFAQGACAFGFLIISLIFVETDGTLIGTIENVFIPFGAFMTGLYLPKIMVSNTRAKRYAIIRKGLPDALDLMMICTEAGLTLNAAMERVNKEIGLSYPELADELSLTSIEMGFLPEKRKALENLSERVTLDEVRAIANVLIQTEKYGTPVSQALRVLSKEFRQQRMLMAEQKAARLPPMMTVPMILFILPTLFIVVITPSIIRAMGAGG